MESKYENENNNNEGDAVQKRFGVKVHQQKISKMERDIQQAKQ